MPITLVLAIGLDSTLFEAQRRTLQSAGYLLTSAWSMKAAIEDFQEGDFDLVVLSHSLPMESIERLTSLIRASGSRVPVVCTTDSSGDFNAFADATVVYEPQELMREIGKVMAKEARDPWAGSKIASRRLARA
jgi:CheY-like chemotaxis protein